MEARLPVRFTLRVYGILISSNQEALISYERIGDFPFTKFPGGGLETGEGTRDALEREFMEETGIRVRTGQLLHITDTFIQSRIDPEEQVIAIYYLVHTVQEADEEKISLSEKEHDFRDQKNRITLEWMALKNLKEEVLTFETDRQALRALLSLLSSPDNCKKST